MPKHWNDTTRARAWVVAGMLLVALGTLTYRATQILAWVPPSFPQGVIRIAVDPSYYPFAFLEEDGTLRGLDVDIGRSLGEHLGLEVQFQVMGVDALHSAVINGSADLIISAMQPEPWRLGDIAYTRPYYDAGLMLVTSTGRDLTTLSALPGHTIAYEFGSEADAEVRRWERRIRAFEEQPYELPDYALDAVRLGEADAALVDSITLRLYRQQHPDWDLQAHFVTHTHFVIALDYNATGTFNAADDALAELMDAGVIDDLIDRWLG